MIRFFLGMFAMIGALVFLGCPWRMILRLAGGDGNAILGLLGLVSGVSVGAFFIKKGFSLGRSYPSSHYSGWAFPLFFLGLFGLLVSGAKFGLEGALFTSETGPGSMHANLWLSLGAGIVFGILAQKSRFCTMGSIRDSILIRDYHLLSGVIALLVVAFGMNLVLGQFNPGFASQPIAHNNHLWNFLGMGLSGMAFVLAGGCPGRQLVMAGEADHDAAVFVMGMIFGAALAHNLSLAASPKGITDYTPYAVGIGFLFCIMVGFTMRTNRSK